MKIYITNLAARSGGGLIYLRNILSSLGDIDSEDTFIVYVNKYARDYIAPFIRGNNIEIRAPKYFGDNAFLALMWEQLCLPVKLMKEKADLLYSPANTCPLLTRRKIVIAIQDIAAYSYSYPEWISVRQLRLLLRRMVYRLSATRTNGVVYVSHSLKKQIEELSNTGRKESAVIYHGVDENMFQRDEREVGRICDRFGIKRNYVLFVSNINEHKNLMNLIEAFAVLNDESNECSLVVAGRIEKNMQKTFMECINERDLMNRVMLIGSVDYTDLPALYSGAKLFVHPSVKESFGMPIIEAMNCGIPVIASDIDVFRELGGEALIYFDPKDPRNIATRIKQGLEDEELTKTKVEEGLRRATLFDWKTCAEQLLCFLHECENSAS